MSENSMTPENRYDLLIRKGSQYKAPQKRLLQ